MAISEACKYEIEESVDKACEEKGIPKAEAFTALQTFYNGIGVPITFGAIKTKYYRAHKEVSNETPPPTPSNNTESQGGKGGKEEKKVMCIECYTRQVRRKRDKNGDWYYYGNQLCQRCCDKEALKKELETAGEVNEAEKIYTPRDVSHISTFIIAHLNEVPTDNNKWREEFEIIISWMNQKLKGE